MDSVSVIVHTYDRPLELDLTLRSLSEQTHRNFEVIVVNDGGKPPDLEPWKGQFPLKLLNLAFRRGTADGRNAGIAVAEGGFLAFLDDHHTYFPNHLECALEPLRAGDADLTYPAVLLNPRSADSLPRRLPPGALCKHYPYDPRFLLVGCYLPTAALVCRRRCVRFEAHYGPEASWELQLRLARREGYLFRDVPEATVTAHDTLEACTNQRPSSRTAAACALDTWRSIAQQYRASDPMTALYRGYFLTFQQLCLDAQTKGYELDPFFHEQFMADLFTAFARGRPVSDARRFIADRFVATAPSEWAAGAA